MDATILLRQLVFCMALACVSAMVVLAMVTEGVVDRPDARKSHVRPTPKGGGVGVIAAFMLGLAVLYGYSSFARIADPYFRGFILASGLIAVVSWLDDQRDWPFTVKLFAQIGAGASAVGFGLYARTFSLPYYGVVDVGWWGGGITLAWVLFATNAVNFMDGLNGLASGTALVACGFLAVVAAQAGGWFVYFCCLLLAAGLAGFLPFNFPRARVFLGDVGSQFCGFVLAVLGVAAARFEAQPLSFLLVPLLLFGLLFDVAFTLVRRVLNGQPITKAHRGFVFQVAHRAGVDARLIAVVHWGFAAWGGLVCLSFAAASESFRPVLPLLALPPQLAWLGYVAWRASRARLGAW